MLSSEKYGVLVFQGADGGLYSFWGDSTSYKVLAKGMPKALYGVGELDMTNLDRVADGANEVVRRANEGQKIDVLRELRKYHKGWDGVEKPLPSV